MESVNTQLELLRERIPYDEVEFETTTIHEETLKKLLEDSKYIALSLRFPYED